MATLYMLPSTVYQGPQSVQAHRPQKQLNTIIEDDEASNRGSLAEPPRLDRRKEGEREREGRREIPAEWKSPMSDNFPTPRGNHFMPAPRMPDTPGSAGFSDQFPTPRGNHFMRAPYIPASPSSSTASEFSETYSMPNTRDSYGTQATDLDDIYGLSSDEEERQKKTTTSRMRRTSSVRKSTASNRMSTASRNSLPSLVIPPSPTHFNNTPAFKFSSPIPPTPPPKVPMSPAIFQYLASQDLLSSSSPPSLDGSLSSEQLAAMSAPPTPNIGNDEEEDSNGWGGVHLQPAAMATLQALSGDDLFERQTEQVIELSQMSPTREMQMSPPPINSEIRRHKSVVLPPDQQQALNSLSMLDIPSPGGFFSNLSPGSRDTWGFDFKMTEEAPPTSTTAEHFYKMPWASEPVERIIDVSEVLSDGCSTARPTFVNHSSEETVTSLNSHVSLQANSFSEELIVATEILADYDDGYVRNLSDIGQENFDRTSLWLNAQTTYLSTLINPPEERDDEVALRKRDEEVAQTLSSKALQTTGKSVRFTEFMTTETKQAIGAVLPKLHRQESAYYRSFLNFVTRSRQRDVFVHSVPRFEAQQTQRVNFPEAHRNRLLGKYQLSVMPMSAKKRMSSNVARGDESTLEDPAKLKADKEREAMEQMSGAAWNVMAMKMLNGGRLIAAPVAKRLARLTRMGPSANGSCRERARILDLGGQGSCDWAWHCAFEYPNTKVYTCTTKGLRQLSNSNIRGPQNHRQVAVEKLTKLPFADNQFDLISARHLHSTLKIASEHGEDEYDACLAECMRVLKPGGYLEFSLFDSDIVNAGSRGQAKSVEFGFSLKTLGYDPTPTKAWLGRLRRAGFMDVKRAWMFLPLGISRPSLPVSRDSMGVERKLELEAMVTGSTGSVAGVTGLLASWAWEKWMLKLQMERGVAEESLLEGVAAVVEECGVVGAGMRTLSGWARKPTL